MDRNEERGKEREKKQVILSNFEIGFKKRKHNYDRFSNNTERETRNIFKLISLYNVIFV